MSPLTERQREVLRFGALRRFPDDRAMSGEVLRDLGVTLRVYKAELSTALAHPDGFAFVHQVTRERDEARTMPEDLLAILLFEARWRTNLGKKADVVQERFGLSLPLYRRRLDEAVNHEAAVKYAPHVVNQLRALAARRATA